jgi:hypothetical protein
VSRHTLRDIGNPELATSSRLQKGEWLVLLPVIRKRRIVNLGRQSGLSPKLEPWAERAERINPMAVTTTNRASRRARWRDRARRRDQSRTLIRHARTGAPLPIRPLAKEVRHSAPLRVLISTVGRAPLLPASIRAAGGAAIALTAVAATADKEQSSTGGATTEARPE